MNHTNLYVVNSRELGLISKLFSVGPLSVVGLTLDADAEPLELISQGG